MRRETLTVRYTCDLCGKECRPIRELNLVHSRGQEFNNEIHLTARAFIPYGTTDGDVCEECLVNALQNYMESKEGDK